MKPWTPLAPLLAFAAFAAPAALAQPVGENPPTSTILCLDVSGRSLPPVCKVPPSRLDPTEDICLCHEGIRVTAPICPPGVKPPTESLALERARRAYLQKGTLVGATFEGRPMCVAGRLTPGR
jgi:hypothetical protein